jgi:hypothetical protein
VLNLAVKGLCLAGLKQSCILFLHHRWVPPPLPFVQILPSIYRPAVESIISGMKPHLLKLASVRPLH